MPFGLRDRRNDSQAIWAQSYLSRSRHPNFRKNFRDLGSIYLPRALEVLFQRTLSGDGFSWRDPQFTLIGRSFTTSITTSLKTHERCRTFAQTNPHKTGSAGNASGRSPAATPRPNQMAAGRLSSSLPTRPRTKVNRSRKL